MQAKIAVISLPASGGGRRSFALETRYFRLWNGGTRMNERTDDGKVTEATFGWLAQRGVDIREIAELVHELQRPYFVDLPVEECMRHVERVLTKREVQNAVLTGIQLDILAERGEIADPLLGMVRRDESLYGCDEILALSVVNVYGSIGLTNYGYLDKVKPGVLQRLNDKGDGRIHTFLDDLVGAVAAAASSRIAHTRRS
jgi:phosphatidylglycerophosphatase A